MSKYVLFQNVDYLFMHSYFYLEYTLKDLAYQQAPALKRLEEQNETFIRS